MKTIISALLLLGFVRCFCQVEYPGEPKSKDITEINFINVRQIVLQDTMVYPPAADTSGPKFIGVRRNLSLNFMQQAEVYIQDSVWIGLLKLKSGKGRMTGVLFDSIILSKNAALFVYNQNKTSLYGAFTYRNILHKRKKTFLTPHVDGEEIIIEVNIPLNELELNSLHVSHLSHRIYSLREIEGYGKAEDINVDYSCNVHVNCQSADPWCNQIRSVARFDYYRSDCTGGYYSCSGALINNENDDFEQFFLTARHCTRCDVDWDNTTFHFNFQRPQCSSGNGQTSWSVQGAEQVTYCDQSWSDNALVRILEPIPLQYNVYYSGFDISSQSLWTNFYCIHHPEGNVKNITSGQLQYYAGPKWDVYWDDGVIAHGSSGAPVFLANNKRIVATISGGGDYECSSNDKHDWVGKLRSCSNIYNNLGSSHAGIDPILACQSNIQLFGIFRDARLYRATKHNITIQAANTITISNANRSDFYDNSNFTLQAGQSIKLLPDNGGTHINRGAKFVAKIANCISTEDVCGINYFTKKENEEVEEQFGKIGKDFSFSLYPNPATSSFSLTVNIPQVNPVEVSLSDIAGRTVKIILKNTLIGTGEHNFTVNTDDLSSGIYFVNLIHGTKKETQRIVISNK